MRDGVAAPGRADARAQCSVIDEALEPTAPTIAVVVDEESAEATMGTPHAMY
jgi:hypothetical protein